MARLVALKAATSPPPIHRSRMPNSGSPPSRRLMAAG
jgi:hypothetical protein